jgi:hypothetical protein
MGMCEAGLTSQESIRLADGSIHLAEVHWYEASGIGRKEFKDQAPPVELCQSRYLNNSSFACRKSVIPHRSRSGRSTWRFAIGPRRSTVSCGLSMNPGMITFIQRHSSARSHCHDPSRRQCWLLLDSIGPCASVVAAPSIRPRGQSRVLSAGCRDVIQPSTGPVMRPHGRRKEEVGIDPINAARKSLE